MDKKFQTVLCNAVILGRTLVCVANYCCACNAQLKAV